MSVASKLEVK